MAKYEKVKSFGGLVTFEGQIELTQQQVLDVQMVLAGKVEQTAVTTEKATMSLYESIKRLGLDLYAV